MNKRMDRSRLNIGAYYLKPYARTEKHIRELKECGIDFVVSMQNDRPALDLFSKYGLGAVVSGVLPGWWGGDGENAGLMEARNPLELYTKAAADFKDHPAIWGVDTGDEPSALDFPHYGKVTALTERLFPNQFAYLNLYPNYASVAKNTAEQTVNQLGTTTYEEHIRKYCENVGLDYLCYDFYMYSLSKNGVERAYKNLRVVAEACRTTGRSMWIVLQVNSNRPEEWIHLDQLRFQAYSALTFGAEVITWGCYTAGWWHNQVLDEQGEKTEQYPKLLKMNRELHAIGPAYMKYRTVSTYFIGFEGQQAQESAGQTAVSELNTGVFLGMRAENGSPLLAGQMVSRDGEGHQAVFLCNAADPWGKQPSKDRIVFSTDGHGVKAVSASGERTLEADADGRFTVELPSCEGLLLVAL